MDIFIIIISFLSKLEKNPYKIAEISPILDHENNFNDTFDIETGLYYHSHRINKYSIIHYPEEEEYNI
jgi:hypothetical protein